MDSRYLEAEKWQESFHEAKRQHDIVRTTLENIKYESEREIQFMKDRHKEEVNELMEENSQLQLRVDDSKDRDLVR